MGHPHNWMDKYRLVSVAEFDKERVHRILQGTDRDICYYGMRDLTGTRHPFDIPVCSSGGLAPLVVDTNNVLQYRRHDICYWVHRDWVRMGLR